MQPSGTTIGFDPLNRQILIRKEGRGRVLKFVPSSMAASEIDGANADHFWPHVRSKVKVDAVLGVMPLLDDQFFVVVRRSRLVGKIAGRPIFCAIEVDFVPIGEDLVDGGQHGKSRGSARDKTFQKMFSRLFSRKCLYYSDRYDLTNSLQRQFSATKNARGIDETFLANKALVGVLKTEPQVDLMEYFPPFILGFVEQKEIFLRPGMKIAFTLIARKSMNRLGARYFSRGIDDSAHVSNFVETEQVIEPLGGSGHLFSFLQIRGSIPIFWSQFPDFKYTPKFAIEAHPALDANYEAHFDHSVSKYGGVQILNLIDKQRSQLRLGEAFRASHDKLSRKQSSAYKERVNYCWFDYHAETKAKKMDSIETLMYSVRQNFEDFGLFEVEFEASDDPRALASKFELKRLQKGVFRTNCVDCLDRTNVIQSVLGRMTADYTLELLGFRSRSSRPLAELPPTLEPVFRNFWADHADALSLLYSGTPALKTDFTRTGKRTIRGMLNDGKTSVIRYFINNFLDGETQDSYNFLTRNNVKNFPFYKPGEGAKFLQTLIIMILIPLLVRAIFWIFGCRFTSAFRNVLTITVGVLILAFFNENRQKVLSSTSPKVI